MRRRLLALGAAAVAAIGGGGVALSSGSAAKRLWVVRSHTFSVCISADCGQYSAELHWNLAPWGHTTTGYYVFLNGTQEADIARSPWVVSGGDCGTTATLGVQPHDGAGNVGPLYTTTYVTPACSSFTVNCPLTYAAGAGSNTLPPTAEDGPSGTCWGQQTGVYHGTGDTEAQIEANPAGLGFTVHTGDLTVSTAGATIDHYWIENGCISIRANNVTVKNTLITDTSPDCSGANTGATAINVDQNPVTAVGTLIEDTTIDGGNPGLNAHTNGLTVQDGEVLRVNLFGYGQGFTSNVNDSTHPSLFQDDYGHDYQGCQHDDGTWVDSGTYVKFAHIWIETNDPTGNATTGGCASGACYGGSDYGPEHDVTYDHSFCDGVDGQDAQTGCGGTNITISNDFFDSTATKAGAFGGFNIADSGNVWTANSFIDHSNVTTTASTPSNPGC